MTGSAVTFYSYKGGVGRTLVLANVGVTLARWGYRVLLVDWDLEAPGLHEYLRALELPTLQGGVVDLLVPQTQSSADAWRSFVVEVGIPGSDDAFHFLPAGGAVADYVERAQRVDYRSLYEKHHLGRRIDEMREAWKQEFDLVLIDSRTGTSDVGSICTVQLPDVLCLCFTTSHQSLNGSLEIARRANTQRARSDLDRGRLLIIPLLTRFDANVEHELSQTWEERVAAAITDPIRDWLPPEVTPSEVLPHLRVPYAPVWTLGEGMPVLQEDSRDPLTVSYAIETIAAVVARRAEEPSLLVENRQLYVAGANRAGAAGRRDARQFSADFALYYEPADGVRAQQLAGALRDAGFSVVADAPDAAELTDQGRDAEITADAAQHVLVLIGERVSNSLQSEYRRLVLGLFASDAPRMVIPILLTPGAADSLPASFRSLQYVDASRLGPQEVVQRIADVTGRVPPSRIGAEYEGGARVDLSAWFMQCRARFDHLVSARGLGERYEHGVWSIGYGLEPAVDLDLSELRAALEQSVGRETGWPVWIWPSDDSTRPRVVDDQIECWLVREDGAFADGASSDFWRATTDCRLYLLRGYQEDSAETRVEPGTGLDFLIPVWRVTEAFLHSMRMAKRIGAERHRVRVRVQWEGLEGRRLISLDPGRHLSWAHVSAQDVVTREIVVPIRTLDEALASAVHEVLKGLYTVFDFFELSYGVVEEVVQQVTARSR